MSFQPESGARAESLRVRRSVELPEADIEAAGDLAPVAASEAVEEGDRPASVSDGAVGSRAAGPVVGKEPADPQERPADTLPSAKAKQDASSARDVAVATPPDSGVGAGGGMPPDDRPKKQVLAAVAIGGAVLLAIPILLIGTGSHDGKKHRSPAAAGTVLGGAGLPPGAFASTSPSVTLSPSASASAKAKSKSGKHGDAAKRPETVSAENAGGGSGRPAGPKFATVTRLLIKNVVTGLCADLPGNGSGASDGPIQQYSCNGASSDNQRWDLVVNDHSGPNGAALFSIRNSKDHYCADLPGTGAAPSKSHVTENRCHPGRGDNQMWYLEKRSTNSFWIRNYLSGKNCLDVMGNDWGNDTALTIYPCDPNDDHQWSFQ